MSAATSHRGPASPAATTLSEAERSDLRNFELVIEHGMATFVAVGNALLEVRDRKLYRETHGTFEAYARDRLGISDRHARRLIDSATIAAQVAPETGPLGPVFAPPTSETQVRPLRAIPAQDRAAAWAEATEAAGGRAPSAAQVTAVVEARRPAPSPPKTGSLGPVSPPTDDLPTDARADDADAAAWAEEEERRLAGRRKGRSIVDGVERDDPPEIAKRRAKGQIAPDVVPVVTTGPEEDPTPYPPAREPGEDKPETIEELLGTFEARPGLSKEARKRFDAEARLYLEVMGPRAAFREETADAVARARRTGGAGGRFFGLLVSLLRSEHPKHWYVCPEEGGCGGKGYIAMLGDERNTCKNCHGRGYRIN